MPDPIDPKASANGNGTDVIDPPKPDALKPLTADDIAKIIDDKLKGYVDQIRSASPAPAPDPSAEANPLDAVAEELAKEEQIDIKVAKAFVNKFVKINEHLNKGTQAELNQFKLEKKFVQVFSQNADADKVAPKMTEVFKKLSPLEQNFVLNSPDGAQYIYDKAKREMGLYVQPAADRAAAGNPPGNSLPADRKMAGSNAILFNKASEALSKGDRAGYDAIMAQIQRG